MATLSGSPDEETRISLESDLKDLFLPLCGKAFCAILRSWVLNENVGVVAAHDAVKSL